MAVTDRAPIVLSTDGSDKVVRWAQYAAVAGLVFQVVHLIEHLAQTGYWFLHPGEAPWLTPWAVLGRDMLVVGDRIVTGNELLHLLGNGIFFGALLAMHWVCRAHKRPPSRYPHLAKAIASQGFHVAEHVLLTVTTFVVGLPMGISTLFGFATGAWGSSYRVWFHFILNFIATYYAAMAMAEMHEDDLVIPGVQRVVATV